MPGDQIAIDMHHPEATRIALNPFEVIEKAPDHIAEDIGALGAGSQRRLDTPSNVIGAMGIADHVTVPNSRAGAARLLPMIPRGAMSIPAVALRRMAR